LDRLVLQELQVVKVALVLLACKATKAPQVLLALLELMEQLVLQEPLVDKVAQERQELKVQQELLV
jgi:hypothetical protein